MFDNVIWSDECTVQMESHRQFACRKQREAPRPKPRYKYNVKSTVLKRLSKFVPGDPVDETTCTVHVA